MEIASERVSSQRRYGWSGDLPQQLIVELCRARIASWLDGPPDHVGWVPLSLHSATCQDLVASSVEQLEQAHWEMAGERWHVYIQRAGPWVIAWVIAIKRWGCQSPVWFGGAGNRLWREITDALGVWLEHLATTDAAVDRGEESFRWSGGGSRRKSEEVMP